VYPAPRASDLLLRQGIDARESHARSLPGRSFPGWERFLTLGADVKLVEENLENTKKSLKKLENRKGLKNSEKITQNSGKAICTFQNHDYFVHRKIMVQ
jgi:hypothetical protein